MTSRQWEARTEKNDEFLAPSGQVLDSMLNEHQCQGWLEGYLLTGRHGLLNSYEAVAHKHYIDKHGEGLPEILNWKWGQAQ